MYSRWKSVPTSAFKENLIVYCMPSRKMVILYGGPWTTWLDDWITYGVSMIVANTDQCEVHAVIVFLRVK